jgi:DNA-binding MarR family transcriptional regulator
MSRPSKTTKPKKRQQLLETLVYQLSRELSTQTVLFHAAIAERMGLSQGDHKALDLINDAAKLTTPMTAGQLAQALALTTGAITGLIDRLEKANLVRRVSDPQDRRKVVLEPTRARDEEMWTMLGSIADGMVAITKHYTDSELEIITDYTRRCIELTENETRRLREIATT